MRFRAGPLTLLLSLGVAVMLGLSVLIGPVSFNLRSVLITIGKKFSQSEIPAELAKIETIVFTLRLPRALMLMLTGAALGCSGASYQGLFRNPLADPFLIGVSAGAGLGAVIAQSIAWRSQTFAPYARPLFALGFGILVVVVVFLIGREHGNDFPANRLILAGVAMNSFCSALISFILIYFRNNFLTSMSWMMGGITLSGWIPVRVILIPVTAGLIGQAAFAYPLNVLQFGDEQAAALGLEPKKIQRRVIFFATLSTSAAISFAGVIGFVGLIIPHVIRFLIGSDYRKILPLSMLGGGFFLMTADLLARRAFAPREFPVGLITALSGAPFFFWLLYRGRAER